MRGEAQVGGSARKARRARARVVGLGSVVGEMITFAMGRRSSLLERDRLLAYGPCGPDARRSVQEADVSAVTRVGGRRGCRRTRCPHPPAHLAAGFGGRARRGTGKVPTRDRSEGGLGLRSRWLASSRRISTCSPRAAPAAAAGQHGRGARRDATASALGADPVADSRGFVVDARHQACAVEGSARSPPTRSRIARSPPAQLAALARAGMSRWRPATRRRPRPSTGRRCASARFPPPPQQGRRDLPTPAQFRSASPPPPGRFGQPTACARHRLSAGRRPRRPAMSSIRARQLARRVRLVAPAHDALGVRRSLAPAARTARRTPRSPRPRARSPRAARWRRRASSGTRSAPRSSRRRRRREVDAAFRRAHPAGRRRAAAGRCTPG